MRSTFWEGKKVLITGHTGFKGAWLSMWLNKMGASVVGLSLPEPVSSPNLFSVLQLEDSIRDIRGNVNDPDVSRDIISNNKPEVLFHLAAQPLVRESYSDPVTTFGTNILGTVNILEAVRTIESVKSIVVVTTDKCYENVEKDYAYTETDPLGGFDPYSSSKACAEIVAASYRRSFFADRNIGLATARAGNVIGGGDWAIDRLIPDAARAWSMNKNLKIRYPMATRPWQHVLEPLSGYILLAEKLWNDPGAFSGAWNFGPDPGSVVSVQDAVSLAAAKWGSNTGWEILDGNHVHEAGLLQLNSSKANKLLGWVTRTDFENAIEGTIEWYRNFYVGDVNMMALTLKQIENFERSNLSV